MSFMNQLGKNPEGVDETTKRDSIEAEDHALEQALANFRSSVIAWSEAGLSHERTPVKTVRQRSWRLAAGWALGCVLVAGGAGGGLFEHQQKLQAARIAEAARAAEQQRAIAEQRAKEEEDLMANVDSDVSREVPSAMEPLAQLMTDDETK
jgi:uncharacterized protein HemX